jgi:hypothetical protein
LSDWEDWIECGVFEEKIKIKNLDRKVKKEKIKTKKKKNIWGLRHAVVRDGNRVTRRCAAAC